MPPFMLALGAKFALVIPILLGGVAILATKAVIISKIAFVIGVALLFQSFFAGGFSTFGNKVIIYYFIHKRLNFLSSIFSKLFYFGSSLDLFLVIVDGLVVIIIILCMEHLGNGPQTTLGDNIHMQDLISKKNRVKVIPIARRTWPIRNKNLKI